MKKIGILGGSGAFGTVHLLHRIFSIATKKYNAIHDHDFPNIIIHNSPLESLDAEAHFTTTTYLNLLKNIKDLESIGCSTIIIACNTLHFYHTEIQKQLLPSTNLVNAFDLLREYCNQQKDNEKKINILCSQNSSELQLHKKYLSPYDILYPNTLVQKDLNKIIEDVIANKQNLYTTLKLQNIINQLEINTTSFTIIACTELSIINYLLNKPYIDTCDIIAEYINKITYQKE
jgi:aspartate racemase